MPVKLFRTITNVMPIGFLGHELVTLVLQLKPAVKEVRGDRETVFIRENFA
jgi:hypothetical protein